MKKVLFTATVDSHILQFHLPFLKLFKDNGYEVHVATNSKEIIPFCDVKHQVQFERSPFQFNNIKAISQLQKICDDEKFDIIHTHTPMGSVVTRIAARKSRKKYHTRVIYTAHGFHFFKGAPLINWLLFYPVEKIMARFTDTIITINQEDYNLALKKFKKNCKDIKYVPGVGIDEKKFRCKMNKKEKRDLKLSLGLNENSFILTYIARLDKNKNQGFLISVMKKIVCNNPDIHLLLVGPDEFNGVYHSQAADVIDNIHFLGYRNDIPQLLNITDVSVSSSLREGLPVNVLEAIFAGVPIVALDNRGTRSLINRNNGFIVKKDNISEFIECIETIYNKKFIFNDKDSQKLYSIDNVLKEMKKIYFGG